MTTRKNADRRRNPRRCRGDAGAGLVEFAMISVLLLMLLFAIINFGLILSLRQDVTRSAAEGARGGAVAVPLSVGQTYSQAATAAATAATNEAVKGIGGSFGSDGCNRDGMTCTTVVGPCAGQSSFDCVTVTVSFDYDGYPLYGNLPLMSAFLPNKIEATSVARINS